MPQGWTFQLRLSAALAVPVTARDTILKIQKQVRTWYGATGRVELHGPFWHLAGLWGIDIPHPPLVNLLIRQGLPAEATRELSFLHELGHLEMLPFALLAAVGLLMQARRTGQLRWSRLPWLWAGHHAIWEMLAEGYVMWRSGSRYKTLYAGRLHSGLLLFWLGTVMLVALTLVGDQSHKRWATASSSSSVILKLRLVYAILS